VLDDLRVITGGKTQVIKQVSRGEIRIGLKPVYSFNHVKLQVASFINPDGFTALDFLFSNDYSGFKKISKWGGER